MAITATTENTTQGDPRATGRAPGPIPAAFAELTDRNDRLEHVIEQLASMIDALADRLAPILPDVPTGEESKILDPGGTPAQIDTRGMVARTISSQANRVDRAADRASFITGRVDRLIDTLEV